MNDEHSNPETLESGWDRTTPAGDTVLHDVIHAIGEDSISAVSALGGRTLSTDDVKAADLGRDALYYNTATILRPLTAEQAPAVIEALNTFFDIGGMSTGMVGIFTLWPLPDYRPHGWTLGGHPPVHFLPAEAVSPPVPDSVTIREADSLDDLEQIVTLANAAFGTSVPPRSVVSEALLADSRRRYWIAEVDGLPAGGSSAFLTESMTYVNMVATDPTYRRRGIGAALSWRAALAQPGLPSTLLSTDEGRHLYDQMGYLRLLRFTFWYRLRGDLTTPSE